MESIEKSDKFISFFGDGYFCTDRDNLQFCRKESETRFRYVEVDKISLYLFLKYNYYKYLLYYILHKNYY